MADDKELIARIESALRDSQPTPVDTALDNLALPGDLPASLRQLLKRPLRPAAVLVPLIDYGNRTQVLLTRRNERLRNHAGQISFPGGAIDAEDDGVVAAAFREATEETGMDTSTAEVIGYLDTYLTITGFAITPVVAKVSADQTLVADPREVAEIFEVPLDFLMYKDNYQQHVGKRDGLRVRFYSVPYQDWNIWGATAGMLLSLAKKL